MAGKGNSRYIKRLSSPEFFGVAKKKIRYVTKPNAGRHTMERCISLALAVKMSGNASTTGEASKAIKSGEVQVNGAVVREPKYPIGLNDTISAGGKTQRVGINAQGKANLYNADGPAVYKIVGKYVASHGKLMLRLHDGSTVVSGGKSMVHDSVAIKSGKIEKEMKLEDGARCEIINGVHVGTKGKVVQLTKGTMHKSRTAIIEGETGKKFETPVGNVMVIL